MISEMPDWSSGRYCAVAADPVSSCRVLNDFCGTFPALWAGNVQGTGSLHTRLLKDESHGVGIWTKSCKGRVA